MIEETILERAKSSGLPASLLRAVYLRETRDATRGGEALCASALLRVDGFICYALSRDTRYARDRDLVPSVVQ